MSAVYNVVYSALRNSDTSRDSFIGHARSSATANLSDFLVGQNCVAMLFALVFLSDIGLEYMDSVKNIFGASNVFQIVQSIVIFVAVLVIYFAATRIAQKRFRYEAMAGATISLPILDKDVLAIATIIVPSFYQPTFAVMKTRKSTFGAYLVQPFVTLNREPFLFRHRVILSHRCEAK